MSGGNRDKDYRMLAAGFVCGGILLAGLAAGSHSHRAAKTDTASPLAAASASNPSTLHPSAILASHPLAKSSRAQLPVAISHPAKREAASMSSAPEFPSAANPSLTISPVARARAMKTFAALPMMFEANSGQTDPRVKFLSRSPGYMLFLTDKEAVLSLLSGSPGAASANAAQDSQKPLETQPDQAQAPELTRTVRLEFAGGNTPTTITGRNQLPGKTSYFLGNDRKQWHRNIANYEGVEYQGVYPGVDVVFHGNQQRLEYDFIVAPGADPNTIALDVVGAKRMRITPRGDVALRAGQSELELELELEKPVIYQEVKGQRREVAGNFVLRSRHRVGFALGPYDRTQPLVIDPTLTYSTYLGKVYLDSGSTAFASVAVDSAGNAYIAGTTLYSSPSFPTFPTTQTCPGDCSNPVAFVMKINPNMSGASSLIYSTYLGPNDSQEGYDTRADAIAVDGNGNAYVAGQTNAYNFPVSTSNAPTVPACGFQNLGLGNLPPSGKYCGFVAELNGSAASGPDLTYSTFIGGSDANGGATANNVATGIAVDSSGDAYVTGYTTSPNLLTSVWTSTSNNNNGQPAPTVLFPSGEFLQGTQNAFVAELKAGATGPYFSYLSYLGGSGTDTATGIALAPNGEAFVAGSTTSTNFPTVNPYQSSLVGPNTSNQNAFFSAVAPGGASLVYSTYLGGTGADIANAVAADSYNNAYITGNLGLTGNSNYEFPVTINTTCSPTIAGDCPLMFVAKLDPSITTGNASLLYSSYLGGNTTPAAGIESAQGIAVDGQGDVFVTGWEHSAKDTGFPLYGYSGALAGSVQPTDPCLPLTTAFLYYSECSAGFLVEFSPEGSIPYATFLGVTAVQATPSFPIVQGTGVALDSQVGDVYIAGLAGGFTPLIETTSNAFMQNPTDQYTGTYDRNGFLSVISALAKPPLAIIPTTLAAGTAGVSYPSVTFTAPQGQGAVTISESGPLPSGMMFSNGTLSGTPTQRGNYPITIAAVDSQGDQGSENLTLVINCPTIVVGPSSLPAGTVGAAYSAAFNENGGVGSITFSQTGLPTGIGLTFTTAGVLSGTPTTAENSLSIVVTATDSNQCSGNVTDTLTINASTTTPVPVMDYETITVTDTPTFPDLYDPETINVTDGVTITPLIGIMVPVASFSTSSVGFGTVAAGSTGTQIVTVSNVGAGQTGLLLTSATIPSGTPFSIGTIACTNGASSFSTTLPSGGACLVPISYAAPASGTPPSTTIIFTDNAALSNLTSTPSGSSYTQTISLSGGGMTAPPPPEPPATVPVPDNETIMVTDTETFRDVVDLETITVSDQVSISVGQSQTITFPTIPTQTYGGGPVTLNATASSYLPVSYAVISGPATVSENILTITGAGSVTVQASQAGNGNYSAATPVSQTFTVNPASQTITFTTPAPATAKSGESFTVAANGGASGNPVIFAVGTGSVCTLSAATYTMTSDTGTCSVIANQAGNSNYTAASQATETVTAVKTVTKVEPMVTFTGAPASAAYLTAFTVATTQNSGVTPTITSTTRSVCTVSSDIITMKSGTGTCILKASWAANDYYLATSLEQSTTATLAGTTTTISGTATLTPKNLKKVTVYFTVTNGTSTAVKGDVTVTASSGETCTGNLVTGSCVLTFAATGPKTLSATYEGNTDDSTSTSPSYPLTVN